MADSGENDRKLLRSHSAFTPSTSTSTPPPTSIPSSAEGSSKAKKMSNLKSVSMSMSTPGPGEQLSIKANVSNTPHTLSMDEAYNKIYENRIRHQKSPSAIMMTPPPKPDKVPADGQLVKVGSNNNDLDPNDNKRLPRQDSPWPWTAADVVEKNQSRPTVRFLSEMNVASVDEGISAAAGSASPQTTTTSDSVTTAKRNVSATGRLNLKEDFVKTNTEEGGISISFENKNLAKGKAGFNEIEGEGSSCRTEVEDSDLFMDAEPSNLDVVPPETTKIITDPVTASPPHLENIIAKLEPSVSVVPEKKIAHGQKSCSSVSSTASSRSQKSVVLRGDLVNTPLAKNVQQTPSNAKMSQQNKLRAQSPLPFSKNAKGSKTGMARTSEHVLNKKTSNISSIHKTPVTSKIPLLKTPEKFINPKLSKIMKATPRPISRPLKGKRLESEFELSPMPSPMSMKTLEQKPLHTPMSNNKRSDVQSTPRSYAERQKAKIEFSKKTDTINNKIKRHINSDATVFESVLKSDLTLQNSPQQQSPVKVKDGLKLDEHVIGIREQRTPKLYDSEEEDTNLQKTKSTLSSSNKTEESTIVVFKKMGNRELPPPKISTSTTIIDDNKIPIDNLESTLHNKTFSIDPKSPVESADCEILSKSEVNPTPKDEDVDDGPILSEAVAVDVETVDQTKKDEEEKPVIKSSNPVKIPCRFKAAGCTEELVCGSLSEDEHRRECQFRPIPCLFNEVCTDVVPYHSFLLHLQKHYLVPNMTNSLVAHVVITDETFLNNDTWTPKWLKEYDANFFLMLTHTKGKTEKLDGSWMCWVWMMGPKEEASKFFYEVQVFKEDRKVFGSFTTQSIRTTQAQILATKSCLSFTDRVVKHITTAEDNFLTDFFIDICISRKSTAASDAPVTYTGRYSIPC